MPAQESTAWLGGCEGYQVETVERRVGERPEIWIFQGHAPGLGLLCDGCGEQCERVHDVARRVPYESDRWKKYTDENGLFGEGSPARTSSKMLKGEVTFQLNLALS